MQCSAVKAHSLGMHSRREVQFRVLDGWPMLRRSLLRGRCNPQAHITAGMARNATDSSRFQKWGNSSACLPRRGSRTVFWEFWHGSVQGFTGLPKLPVVLWLTSSAGLRQPKEKWKEQPRTPEARAKKTPCHRTGMSSHTGPHHATLLPFRSSQLSTIHSFWTKQPVRMFFGSQLVFYAFSFFKLFFFFFFFPLLRRFSTLWAFFFFPIFPNR